MDDELIGKHHEYSPVDEWLIYVYIDEWDTTKWDAHPSMKSTGVSIAPDIFANFGFGLCKHIFCVVK